MLTIHEDTDGASRNGGGSSGGQGSNIAVGTPAGEHKSRRKGERKSKEDGERSISDEVTGNGELDSKMEDDSSATLSTSSVEVEQDEPLKFATSQSVLQESKSGHSDGEIGDVPDGKVGHRLHSFTSTPKRPSKFGLCSQ